MKRSTKIINNAHSKNTKISETITSFHECLLLKLHSKGNWYSDMQCGENNSLSVIVIIKFNHILNCNHEVVMNILQCLLNSTGQIHVYVKIYSAPLPMN